MHLLARLSPLAAALVAAGGQLAAQCLPSDGLNGPCCATVAPALPAFPAVTLPGLSICWDACVPAATPCAQVALSAPTSVLCGELTAGLDTTDCAGTPELTGTLQLAYTRTWRELPPSGATLQVWRFVVRADLELAGTGGACPLPSCLPTHPTAFYHGYLDYALDCDTGAWEAALVVAHGCDRYQHDPLWSSRPGAFHPDRSYALVAPSVASNPFVPSLATPSGGSLVGEGIRDAVDLVTLFCEAEELLASGSATPIVSACACPLSLVPPQVTARVLDGASTCGSEFRSLDTLPVLPWLHAMATSIGSWSNDSSYPGAESVWIEEGAFLHVEACTPSGGPETFAEVKVGATTEGGYLATVGPALGDRFTDLASNFSANVSGPILPPFFGSVLPTRHLVYVNTF